MSPRGPRTAPWRASAPPSNARCEETPHGAAGVRRLRRRVPRSVVCSTLSPCLRRVGMSTGARVESALVLDPKVFKAYDVRGLYPDELDEEGACAIGRAYVEQFEPRRIAVGRDMRIHGP